MCQSDILLCDILAPSPLPQVDPSYRLFSSDTRGAASFALAVLRASEAQLVAPELRAAVREAATAVLPLQVWSGLGVPLGEWTGCESQLAVGSSLGGATADSR